MRIVTLLFLAALSLFAPRAAAAPCDADPANNPGTGCLNEGVARTMVTQAASAAFVSFKQQYPNAEMKPPVTNPTAKYVSIGFSYNPGAQAVRTYYRYYVTACAGLSATQTRANMSLHPNLSLFCDGGCERRFDHSTNPDDKYIVESGPYAGYWIDGTGTATGRTCDPNKEPEPPKEPPPPECADGQKRLPDGTCANQGDCPVGQHKVGDKCEPDGACPTGKIKGPDGSCVDEGCPAGQVKGKDGTCKKDGDGDGDPDDGEDDGKFSGGESCKEPPKCSGDNIMCGQARIQWRIDCNTRRNDTITGGGACSAPPVCTGEKCSAMEFSQLLQAWRTACATEQLARGVPGGGDGQPAWTKADGMNQNPGQGSSAGDTDIWKTGDPIDGSGLDSSGFVGGGGTCPGFGAASGGGSLSGGFFSQLASPPPMWCGFINWAGIVINVFALVAAIYILARP